MRPVVFGEHLWNSHGEERVVCCKEFQDAKCQRIGYLGVLRLTPVLYVSGRIATESAYTMARTCPPSNLGSAMLQDFGC